MNKLFPEYLADKGVVSAEDVVRALNEQARGAASPCEILCSMGLLTYEKALVALCKQSIEGVTFQQACRDLGFWPDDANTIIQEETLKNRKALVSILVESGKADVETLSRSFDEYLSEHAEENLAQNAKQPPSEQAPTPAVAAPVAAAPVTAAPVAAASGAVASVVSEPKKSVSSDHEKFVLTEIMSDFERQHFLDGIAVLQSAGETEESLAKVRASAKQCVQIVHQMKGAARYLHIPSMESLLAELESILGLLDGPTLKLYAPKLSDIHKILIHGFNALWDGRNLLLANPVAGEADLAGCADAVQSLKMLREVLAP